MRTEFAPSYPISIFMAGDIELARMACAKFCDDVGLCVTVTPTTYVYTGGEEHGVIVGLINYPRFPAYEDDLRETAENLGRALRKALGQESFTIQTPSGTYWRSWRKANVAASADTRPEGGDSTKIEAPFTGGAVPRADEADAQGDTGSTPSPIGEL